VHVKFLKSFSKPIIQNKSNQESRVYGLRVASIRISRKHGSLTHVIETWRAWKERRRVIGRKRMKGDKEGDNEGREGWRE
jgi:hypothetical protein